MANEERFDIRMSVDSLRRHLNWPRHAWLNFTVSSNLQQYLLLIIVQATAKAVNDTMCSTHPLTWGNIDREWKMLPNSQIRAACLQLAEQMSEVPDNTTAARLDAAAEFRLYHTRRAWQDRQRLKRRVDAAQATPSEGTIQDRQEAAKRDPGKVMSIESILHSEPT